MLGGCHWSPGGLSKDLKMCMTCGSFKWTGGGTQSAFLRSVECWGQLVLNSRETEREWRLINISSLLPSAVNRRCGRPHYRIIECLFRFIWFIFKNRGFWRSLHTLNYSVTERKNTVSLFYSTNTNDNCKKLQVFHFWGFLGGRALEILKNDFACWCQQRRP